MLVLGLADKNINYFPRFLHEYTIYECITEKFTSAKYMNTVSESAP